MSLLGRDFGLRVCHVVLRQPGSLLLEETELQVPVS